ncbi:hypothetical protein ES703_00339 [subsurface metagenome]
MIDLRPPTEATVSPGVPKLLQDNYFVRFTKAWEESGRCAHFAGNLYQIKRTNQVPYDLHYIIPTADFRDVDLSNAAGGERIYPENTATLYEVALGFKPGNYLIDIFLPAGVDVSRLEQANMIPNLANVILRYLGAVKPSDSPYDDKRLFMYFVADLEPAILRTYVDGGVAFEKCVFGLLVNKCYLQQIVSPTPEQIKLAKEILFYTELRW